MWSSLRRLALSSKIAFPAFSLLLLKVERKINHTSRYISFPILGSVFFAVKATSFSANQPHLTSNDVALITKEADALANENNYAKVLELLRPYKESGKEPLIWRLSRAAYKMSKTPNLSKTEYAALIEEAYSMAKLALEINDNSSCAHKWMSVVMDAHSALLGFRTRCSTLVAVKDHMVRSLELDPSDATVMYMLGMWYYGIADLAWYQRQILQAIGSNPPTATFEEALAYFKKAEEVSPNFYSLNLLMLGKCHLQLGDKDTAAVYLQQAASYPRHTEDDHQAHQEASELLAKLRKT